MDARYQNILNTHKCYYCGSDTQLRVFNTNDHPNNRTIEHILPRSLIKNVLYNTITCCVFCNDIHAEILNQIVDLNRILNRTRKKKRLEGINVALDKLKKAIKAIRLITNMPTYNPCIIYISLIKNAHKDLNYYIGSLQLNNQSYTNVPQ